MSESGPAAPKEPARRFNWLAAALIVSLAFNLLVIGAAAARYYAGSAPERYQGMGQMQIIPRKFLGEMERERKMELFGVFRDYRPAFRDGRRAMREDILAIAAALEAEPYDGEKLKQAVAQFSGRGAELAATGGEAALALIGKLTPGERKLLATHIRLREDRGRQGRKQKPEEP